MQIDDQAFDFSTLGQRDHAWGNRVWGLNQHYKWFHATTPHAAAHFFEMQSFGAVHVRGFVFRDGAMAQVTAVRHEFLFDDEMHHLAIDVVLEDDLGRTTAIKCKRFAKFRFDADPMIVLNEAAITVDMAGEKGAGWCEFCWNRGYLEFARKHVGQFQPYPHLTARDD